MAHVPQSSSPSPGDRARAAYDDVPYASRPYWDTYPSRLATIARLFGMQPARPDKCRVLELGCAAGGNLIPMAEQLTQSEFVGIDVSPVQIDEGRRTVAAIGLDNIRLEAADICNVDASYGQFDYIVAHGLFSWVPREIQDQVLRICGENLAPHGVAFVSYNTFPGWHAKTAIRDLMCYRARGIEKRGEAGRQARALLETIIERGVCADDAMRDAMVKEIAEMRNQSEFYVVHEHLEDNNVPLYFHEFVERAAGVGLQYLGESPIRLMAPNVATPQAWELLQQVAGSLVEIEQYVDFLVNRTFRETLLCHGEIVLDRNLSPTSLAEMFVASWAKTNSPREQARTMDAVKFATQRGHFESTNPLVKSALFHLSDVWPRAISFGQLFNAACAASGVAATPVVAGELAANLLRCYCAEFVDISVHALPIASELSERPVATRLARYQAQHYTTAANLWHSSVPMNDYERLLLPRLDGTCDRAALVNLFVQMAVSGAITVYDGDRPTVNPQRLATLLVDSVRISLEGLAKKGLLVA